MSTIKFFLPENGYQRFQIDERIFRYWAPDLSLQELLRIVHADYDKEPLTVCLPLSDESDYMDEVTSDSYIVLQLFQNKIVVNDSLFSITKAYFHDELLAFVLNHSDMLACPLNAERHLRNLSIDEDKKLYIARYSEIAAEIKAEFLEYKKKTH